MKPLLFVNLALTIAFPTTGGKSPVGKVPVIIPDKVITSHVEPLQAKPKEEVQEIPVAPPQPVEPVPVASQPVSGCGDNFYANYIYMHESGCNPSATNAGGCYGIGQDCNGIVRSRCGAAYACQNEYFTSYANSRYGGWEAAYQAWIGKHWW